jgi:DNA-binding response OmpR family regulator
MCANIVRGVNGSRTMNVKAGRPVDVRLPLAATIAKKMKKIILVEDDESISDAFSMAFEGPEYKVTWYDSGYNLLKNDYELPDLFILDRQLSGVDGLDICRHLKRSQQSKNIPVVMISASLNIIALSKRAGADDVLVKPYRLAALRAMVHKHTQ